MALGREADIPELTNATLNKDDVVKADREDDPEKIADEIIMKASEFLFLVHYKYYVVLWHKIFVPVLFGTFFSNHASNVQSWQKGFVTLPLFSLFYLETVRDQRFTFIERALQIFSPLPLNSFLVLCRIFVTHFDSYFPTLSRERMGTCKLKCCFHRKLI